MSDDKKLSGMVACDFCPEPHLPVRLPTPCKNPRPASPTPEQPAQDLTEEEVAEATTLLGAIAARPGWPRSAALFARLLAEVQRRRQEKP